MKLIPKIFPRSDAQKEAELEQKLLRLEAKVGGELFGPIQPGGRREFFCLDRHTWIWHEEWNDTAGKRQILTTRYNVRPDGVLKSQNGHSYQRLSNQEAATLFQTAQLYQQRVDSEYQRILKAV